MYWKKGCPRCHGDMFLDRDSYGYYRHCVQCGNLVDVSTAEARMLLTGETEPEAEREPAIQRVA